MSAFGDVSHLSVNDQAELYRFEKTLKRAAELSDAGMERSLAGAKAYCEIYADDPELEQAVQKVIDKRAQHGDSV